MLLCCCHVSPLMPSYLQRENPRGLWRATKLTHFLQLYCNCSPFPPTPFVPGEDGPTHQPVEMLDSLRAMPNLHVFRPADRNETKAAYVLAMKHRHTPTVISLSRQNTPYIAGNGAGCTVGTYTCGAP